MSQDSTRQRTRATDPTAASHSSLSDEDQILELLSGKYRAQAISTIAAIGVPELLGAGPKTISEIASALGCDEKPLDRLLRFTVGLGALNCSELDVYSLTSLGEKLRPDALGRLATFIGSPEQWDPWARLRGTLTSGAGEDAPTPFEATFGTDLYTYLADSPDAAVTYDLGIDAFTGEEASALCKAFDFSGTKSLVDVGGGQGKLLEEILTRWPDLAGVLVDRPDVVDRAAKRWPAALAERTGWHGANFFESIPSGHDCYCLKHVLHNWDDERATALLTDCAKTLAPGGRILVIEAILTPDNRPDLARVLDLEMSILTTGHVRRKPELRRMFRAAGLKIESVQPVGPSWLLVGAPL